MIGVPRPPGVRGAHYAVQGSSGNRGISLIPTVTTKNVIEQEIPLASPEQQHNLFEEAEQISRIVREQGLLRRSGLMRTGPAQNCL